MGDFLGDRYNSKFLVIIIGIVSLLAFIPYLTLQIKGMGYIFNVLTFDNISYNNGALLALGVVVIYVATSGVRGAAWSDVFQAIPDVNCSLGFRNIFCRIIAWFSWQHVWQNYLKTTQIF